MTWLMALLPNDKRRHVPPFGEMVAPLAQGGERLLRVAREGVLRALLEELLESGGGPGALAERGAGEGGAKARVRREGARGVLLNQGLEGLRCVGELARRRERLRAIERLALAAAPVGPELGLGRFDPAQPGRD